MADNEFALIDRYFRHQRANRPDVILGVGDDCALLTVPVGQQLAVSVDLLAAGVHFFADGDPEAIGHKALAVNLSDLAAMGARPAWATLALAMPQPQADWLAPFCRGLFALADRYDVQLVGGDTTRGPLTLSLQVHGFVPEEQALRRGGARPGDHIFVTGTLGDAALALAAAEGRVGLESSEEAVLRLRLERPEPRIAAGLALRGIASAAIDISDGLAQDLGHILESSRVGARLEVDRLPRSPALEAAVDPEQALALALGGGDDYELCFTVPPERLSRLTEAAGQWDCACTEVGVIEADDGLRCVRGDGRVYHPGKLGYDHFA